VSLSLPTGRADGSYLHLEFQTQFRREELDRFKLYDTLLYESKKRHIHTFVIYGADVKRAEEVLDHGSITYTAHAIYMSRYDGDQILTQLREKLVREESLTKQDQLNMIFLPLMRSGVNRRERAKEAVELANRIPDRNLQSRLMGTIIAIADKFLDDETIKEMLEVMNMSKMYQMILQEGKQEGLHEGIALGKQEGKQEAQILIAKNLLSLGIRLRKIAEGTGLSIDEVKKLRETH
jgi:predicted transposase YdaD